MPSSDGPRAAAGNTPDRPLAGMRDVDLPTVGLTADLADRRDAVAELGEALRALTSAAIGSEVAVEVLRQVADDARGLAATLGRTATTSGRAVLGRRPAPRSAPVQPGRRAGQPGRATGARRGRRRHSGGLVHARLALRGPVQVRPRRCQRPPARPDHGVRGCRGRTSWRDRPAGGPVPLDGPARPTAAARGAPRRRARRARGGQGIDQPRSGPGRPARRGRGTLRGAPPGTGDTVVRTRRRDGGLTPQPTASTRRRSPGAATGAGTVAARPATGTALGCAAMGLLDGKNIVVTGVLTDASLAFGVAQRALAEGAEVVLTGAGRALRLTERTARKLDGDVAVYELDVTVPEHGDAVRAAVAERWGRVDGVLHAIGFAPEACLGDDFMAAQWDDVAVALHVSAYSLKMLADTFVPLMTEGGAFVGLDFDNQQAWPAYNWMGVAKSALQSVSRYLAKELGPRQIRSNLVAAGPIKTIAAKSIPGFSKFEDVWDDRAPLGWDVTNSDPVARACVALLSDLFPATTGEIIHVDGGYHAVGA